MKAISYWNDDLENKNLEWYDWATPIPESHKKGQEDNNSWIELIWLDVIDIPALMTNFQSPVTLGTCEDCLLAWLLKVRYRIA